MKLHDADTGYITTRVLHVGEAKVVKRMNRVPESYPTNIIDGVRWFKWQERWWPDKFMLFLNALHISIHDLNIKAINIGIPQGGHVFIRHLYEDDAHTLALIDFIENKIEELEGFVEQKNEAKFKAVI